MGDETRNAIAIVFSCPGERHVAFACTHPNWKGLEAVRIATAQKVLGLARKACSAAGLTEQQVPIVMCGDFNTTPDKLTVPCNSAYDQGPQMFTYLTEYIGLREAYTSNEQKAFQCTPGIPREAFQRTGELKQRSRFTYADLKGQLRDYEVMDFIFHSPTLEVVRLLQMDRDAILHGRPCIPHA